ncbi:MAG: Flp pilus assembly complex ATPase component TadA, partial [Bacilli bacterium]|nr:Flp pilus assembly complex ATPase component TadA [Bacilli bacterium]
SNVMGTTFNMAHPFLDAESAELRMNFVHESIATNGVACLIRKTPAKIRLNKDKLIDEQYVTAQLHDFLIKCVEGHCNIMVAGETGSGKTELVKYLASKTKEDEKIISIEDTLELHLDKIFPTRDIVAMKTNNIASYTESLVACMRQNPIWILLSEVRSAEAVLAVRNSISSGHHILSTIHADKASSIPMRMYSLLESSQDIDQFLGSIHRYVQIGIYVKGYFSKRLGRFQREIIEVCEFYIDEDNRARSNNLYQKSLDGRVVLHNPTHNLIDYLAIGNVTLPEDTFGLGPSNEGFDDTNKVEMPAPETVKPTNTEDPFAMNDDGSTSTSTNQTSTLNTNQNPTAQVNPMNGQPQAVNGGMGNPGIQQMQPQQVSMPTNQNVVTQVPQGMNVSSPVQQPQVQNVAAQLNQASVSSAPQPAPMPTPQVTQSATPMMQQAMPQPQPIPMPNPVSNPGAVS